MSTLDAKKRLTIREMMTYKRLGHNKTISHELRKTLKRSRKQFKSRNIFSVDTEFSRHDHVMDTYLTVKKNVTLYYLCNCHLCALFEVWSVIFKALLRKLSEIVWQILRCTGWDFS